MGDNAAADCKGMFIIHCIVISDSGDAAMNISAAQIFGTYLFPSCSFHQRWASQENSAISSHNHRFIAHGGNIGSSGCTRTHHCCNLRDTLARHTRLIVEDASKVVTIWEDISL